jgi:hypothetical protein
MRLAPSRNTPSPSFSLGFGQRASLQAIVAPEPMGSRPALPVSMGARWRNTGHSCIPAGKTLLKRAQTDSFYARHFRWNPRLFRASFADNIRQSAYRRRRVYAAGPSRRSWSKTQTRSRKAAGASKGTTGLSACQFAGTSGATDARGIAAGSNGRSRLWSFAAASGARYPRTGLR